MQNKIHSRQIHNRTIFTGDNLPIVRGACNRTTGTDTMADLMARLATQVAARI